MRHETQCRMCCRRGHTLTKGARQLVVQEALEMMASECL
jgi:hypothetical protein